MRWEQHKGVWCWRDDLYEVAGVRGGKVRTCWALVQQALTEYAPGLVTAGSRQSPQVNIVAQLGAYAGLPVRCYVPSGPLTPELEAAAAAGAELVPTKPGYNSVIRARAREDSEATGYYHIPFGMECAEAVEQTQRAASTTDWPECKQLVLAVGSGMSLAGVLQALAWAQRWAPGGWVAPQVLGVYVGADPTPRLDGWGPPLWRAMCTLVPSELDYHKHAPAKWCNHFGWPLDPVYEAKAVPYLNEGDAFWIVGIRQQLEAT